MSRCGSIAIAIASATASRSSPHASGDLSTRIPCSVPCSSTRATLAEKPPPGSRARLATTVFGAHAKNGS